jgi:mono/diheme cytochrome c family protein
MPTNRSALRARLGLVLVAAGAATSVAVLRAASGQEPLPPPPSRLTLADWQLSPAETRGRAVYESYCIGCHGAEGRGDGTAARFLDPLPRDFQAGKFKFRSTPFGELPLETDLMRTVTCGLPGSSMPGFQLVPEMERRDVVSYVLTLAKLGYANRRVTALVADDGMTLEQIKANELPAIRAEIDADLAAVRRVTSSPETEASPASVELGRVLFAQTCASCHGDRGVGDGPSAHALRDWQDAEIRPRDLTTGVFRAGSTPEDVFVRIKTGLNGTPMPSNSNLPDDQIWDLVHFIRSLEDPRAVKPREQPGCEHAGSRR